MIERYRVPPEGSIVVALGEGDELTIEDPEGGQVAELDGERFFDGSQGPGARESIRIPRPALTCIAAPGSLMRVDESTPPTELTVTVRRAGLGDRAEPPLPPPLAPVRAEFRVSRATALAYEVGEGEYVQILDVAGRQCSDFLAFDAKALGRGVERGLDATATRTVMGRACPQPGLYAKFLDADMRPLVEVVRDTVGRHDTFGLACTAKYYEDQGYPGHANCSDNFSAALAPNGVAARRGWPAINFFYNTAFDRNQVLYLDESWSRPGDYVLLRATTNLICASSACPDDIDAANGWNPTDIHVRIYEAKRSFSKGVAYRMMPDSVPQLTRETPFHPRTSALTRHFVEYRGYWMPGCFANEGPVKEYHACRERAVIMDLSALRKFEVMGPDAEALLQATLTRNVRRLAVGQVAYTAMCYETGGMLDDGTVMRLGRDNFRWVCGNDYSGVWLREQAAKRGMRVLVKTSTEQLCNFAVQGPRSRDILKEVIWTQPVATKLEELKWFRFTIGRLRDADGPAVLVSRTGYTGELGYEIWCHPKDALPVWDAVVAAGEPHDLTPLGMDALDMLRIEAGLVFAGFDFDDTTSPFEAGIGFTVAADKEEDYVGRTALQRHREHPHRTLVGLNLDGNEVASHGDCVHVGRSQVGVITSATSSPLLRMSIALCRVAIEYATQGTRVEVGKLDGHQKRLGATVTRIPFYDPEKTRVRS